MPLEAEAKPAAPPKRPIKRTPISKVDSPLNLASYIQAAIKIVAGEPIRAVAQQTGIGHNQSRQVGLICGVTVEEFREQARIRGQRILDLIDEMAFSDIAALKPMERQIAYGIRMDKYRDLTGGTAPTSVHVTNIQVNGASRSEALAALTGARQTLKQADQAIGESGNQSAESFATPSRDPRNPATHDAEISQAEPQKDA